MMKQVYLILAALMLLCLAPMPYGYFQFNHGDAASLSAMTRKDNG